jgi:DNA-directed RNA polymerase subunit RPC12/RpoP
VADQHPFPPDTNSLLRPQSSNPSDNLTLPGPSSLPLPQPPSSQNGPRRSSRKRVKKVRTAPLTIADRRRIDDAYTDPPPSHLQEADIDIVDLQHALDLIEDQPEHEEPSPNLQDTIVTSPDLLAPPSEFPIGACGKSPLETYKDAHPSWFVRVILLLVAVLHTKHHVTFRACGLILFVLSVIFSHLSLTSAHDAIPHTLDTVLIWLNLQDRFTSCPACVICQQTFRSTTPHGSRCPQCNEDIFIKNSPTLFQRLTGKRPPPPPPRLSVPIRTLSALLTDAFAHGPLEDQVLEWMSYPSRSGHYNGFMDGRVAQELKDHAGNLFFDRNSLDADEIRLGVTWSVDWYVCISLPDQF